MLIIKRKTKEAIRFYDKYGTLVGLVFLDEIKEREATLKIKTYNGIKVYRQPIKNVEKDK